MFKKQFIIAFVDASGITQFVSENNKPIIFSDIESAERYAVEKQVKNVKIYSREVTPFFLEEDFVANSGGHFE